MLISKAKINTGRQHEIDLLKAFTVVFSMIIIHVFDYDTTGFETGFTWFLDIIFGGIFAAPMFMFCMGIGMEYSRNNDPKQKMIRGIKLLTVGQVLNLFRYSLIFGIQGVLEPQYNLLPAQVLNFSSDIMQLAGLSFILMGMLCKLKLKNWMILAVGAVMSICGTLLEHVGTGCYAFDQLLGFFWGTDTESYFPLFNWFIFIAAGKCFGSAYQRVADKNLFHAIAAPVGIVCFAAVWYLQKHTNCTLFNSFDELGYGFSWMRLPDAISVIIMAPAVISVFYVLSKILPEKTLGVMTHPSKHINQYYCVSWWWIMVLHLYIWADNTAALMSVWFNILTLTVVSIVLYNNHLKEKVEAIIARHRTILTILVWTITIGLALFASATCSELPNEFNNYLLD